MISGCPHFPYASRRTAANPDSYPRLSPDAVNGGFDFGFEEATQFLVGVDQPLLFFDQPKQPCKPGGE